MSLRRPDRRARLDALSRGRAAAWLLVPVLLLAVVLACGSSGSAGRYHTLKRGENLYRLGKRYGVPASEIARANRIDDVTNLSVGQRIWIPDRPGARPPPDAGRAKAKDSVRRAQGIELLWPVRGRLTSRFGRRNGRPHEGIDLAARPGTPIRAAESGRVIFSGRLGGYGKVVVVKHAGAFRTVYAHASRLHVRKGEFVEKGERIASVGSTGRSSGPHLHFEVRQGKTAKDPLLYLP